MEDFTMNENICVEYNTFKITFVHSGIDLNAIDKEHTLIKFCYKLEAITVKQITLCALWSKALTFGNER